MNNKLADRIVLYDESGEVLRAETKNIINDLDRKSSLIRFGPNEHKTALKILKEIKSGKYIRLLCNFFEVFPVRILFDDVDLTAEKITGDLIIYIPYLNVKWLYHGNPSIEKLQDDAFVLRVWWQGQGLNPAWNEDPIIQKVISFATYSQINSIADNVTAVYSKSSILAALFFLPKEYLKSGYVDIKSKRVKI